LSAIRKYIRNHPETISQKVEIIIRHFDATIAPLLQGKAKAMIVTNSRESAVRYKLAVDNYLRENNFSYKSLVAFSDEKEIDGQKYTESSLNGFAESQTIEEFKKRENRFLIVANKHQTGFDQPLLCAMYVDKILSGVNAVQTLSRLNRMSKHKENVFVLDFANTTDDIKKAFDDYYTTTILSEGLNENIINDTVSAIVGIYTFDKVDVELFTTIIDSSPTEDFHGAVSGLLSKVANAVSDALREDDLKELRSKLSFFVKLYPYAESVLGYGNREHEAYYWFWKYLLRVLKREKRSPLDIEGLLDTENIRIIKKEREREVALDSSEGDVHNIVSIPGQVSDDGEVDTLVEIIKKANEEWGAEFGKDQVETLERMQDEFEEDDDLSHAIKNNMTRRNAVSVKFMGTFDKKVNEQYELDNLLWEQIEANDDLKYFVREKMLDSLFKRNRERV